VAVAIATALTLAGCSSDKASGRAEPDKFPAPVAAGGAPDVNTVPTAAPAPKSSTQERDRAIAGLVADRENARHAEQGARALPVAVRPLADAPPTPPADLATPPKPAAAKPAAVERLAVPAPGRPAEAQAAAPEGSQPAPAPAPVQAPGPSRAAALTGPRQAPALPQTNDPTGEGRGTIYASVAGFRPLSAFNAGAFRTSLQLGTLDLSGANMSAADRSTLSGAALKQGEQKGVLRVIAHGNGSLRSAQERAATAARELERLGVPADQLYVGADAGNGSTEIFLHY
jgi:hypothetical protein